MSTKGSQGRSSSANPANLDEIKESLSRIENVLNQGQQVLYGDDADGGEPADAGAVAVRAEDDHHTYHSYHSTPNKHAAANATSQDYQRSPAVHPPVPPRHAEPAAAPSPYHQAYYGHGATRDLDHSRHSLHDSQTHGNSGSAARARTTPAHLSAARRGSKAKKKEEEELSASARALKIQEIKKSSGRVPNFEEGVDDDDTAQNMSIEELKERIRRELEEYQRNGPLMHRRASYQRKQRAATVPRASGAPKAAPSPAPAAGASRSLPPPRAAVPKAKTTKHVAGSQQHQQATPVRAAGSRSAVPPPPPARASTKKTSTSSLAAKPRAKTAAPPAPRAAPAANTRQSAKPFWERLYGDAAVQQEKRDQRAEQRRIELEAERAKAMPRRRSHRPPAHTAYASYYRNLHSNGDSATQSRDLSASRARAGVNVPAQHASYVPKRTVAAPASTAAPAMSSGAANGHSASGAPARVAPRRPVAQPTAKNSLGAAPRPVPLPLGPGPRIVTEADAEHREQELLVPTPPPPPQPTSSSIKGSRGRSNEPFGDELDDSTAHPAQNGPRAAAEDGHVRHSDSDSDADSEENAKSTSHPFVSRLDLSGIKK